MVKMACILLAAMFFAGESQRRTNSFDDGTRDRFFYVFLAIILIFFAGLRVKYNDTSTYIGSYNDPNDTPLLRELLRDKELLKNLGENPGFRIFNSFMRSIGFDSHLFIMTYAIIGVSLNLWFIQKHTDDFRFAAFHYFVNGYMFAFAAIKQSTAAAISLVAVDAAMEGKWGKYAFFLILATLFHPYSLIFLIVPLFINKKPWSTLTYIILGIFLVLGVAFPITARLMSQLAELVGDSFSEDDLLAGGVNVFRFLTYFACIALYFLFRKQIYNDSSKEDDLIFQLAIFGSMFMFLALFGNQILIGRVPSYFSAYNTLALTFACNKISRSEGNRSIKPLVFALFLVYFWYEHLHLKPFWSRYDAITIKQFFSYVLQYLGGLVK